MAQGRGEMRGPGCLVLGSPFAYGGLLERHHTGRKKNVSAWPWTGIKACLFVIALTSFVSSLYVNFNMPRLELNAPLGALERATQNVLSAHASKFAHQIPVAVTGVHTDFMGRKALLRHFRKKQ
eukprot:TRINITY_DN1575_c0_g1_i1.p1 TRINITY_DN1575_c0_g1~~TRINITY_DN1575_c0_g1_i1.p1  ORF type:complete len:124 (-),score=1.37 TRINITY_DN1575_c0_g1_i1:356-727(-)